MSSKLAILFQKINKIKINENATIFKENDDYIYDYYEKRDYIMRETIREYMTSKAGDKQSWTLVPFGRLKKIWEDAAKYGVVRDEKGLNMIESILEENVIKIDVNNELLGHATHLPTDDLEDEGYSEEQLREKWDAEGDVYFVAPNGQLRISDYGLQPLQKHLNSLKKEHDPSRKMMYMDMILNVVHQRSDLASWFVEGGSQALSQLSGTDDRPISNHLE
jgi:hypothetical protein